MKYSMCLIGFYLLICNNVVGQISSINETTKTINTNSYFMDSEILDRNIKQIISEYNKKRNTINNNIQNLKNNNDTIYKSDAENLKIKALLDLNQRRKSISDINIDVLSYYDKNLPLKKRAIEIYLLKIKSFDDKIEKLQKGLDNVFNEYDYLDIKKEIEDLNSQKLAFSENYLLLLKEKISPSVLMPTLDPFFRDYFFQKYYNKTSNNTSFLNSLSYLNSDSSNLLATELVSDSFSVLRLSFGSAISFDDSSETTDQQKNIEKLINTGGNFYFDVVLPIVSTYDSKYLTYYGFTNLKLGTNIAGFDSDIENTNFNASFGIKNYLSVVSDKKSFLFSFLIDSNLHYGSNDLFESLNVKKHVLFNTNFIAYLTISQKYRIALRTNLASHENLRTQRVAFGLQLLK